MSDDETLSPALLIEPGAENAAAPYQVLARKYRPQNFNDLIGHEAMVKTLRNAFASGRIAHAYVLTGVRGVGKTTTARILARALNYVEPGGADNGPQIDMPDEGVHCRAIAESRHPDVMEMDAASRTGVNDVRELIDGVRYAPVEARYKVYIIDEVHMLSTQAFNALLKTLEEPPPHVKFIFATTEIRKLPITVLSRCQRFDLRRIDPETLVAHLGAIADKENAKVAADGLAMIARAAEGSVRDGLSILDQALVQHHDKKEEISAETVREMLGLADRTQTWAVLGDLFKGDAKAALSGFRAQYDAGADPVVIIRDLLELVHLLTKIKAAGPEAARFGPAGEADADRATTMAGELAMNALTRAWSLLMKGLTETQMAPDPAAAGEMALIRLAYAADLPTPDEALRALSQSASAPTPETRRSSNAAATTPNAGAAIAPDATTDAANGAATGAVSGVASGVPSGVEAHRDQFSGPRATDASMQSAAAEYSSAAATARETAPASDRYLQTAPAERGRNAEISSLEDVVRLAGRHRDAKLRTELESYVHVVSFEPGRVEMRLAEEAPTDLPGRLTRALKSWTGDHWVVTVNANARGAAALREAKTAEVMAHPLVARTFELFPDAALAAIRDASPTLIEDGSNGVDNDDGAAQVGDNSVPPENDA